MPVTSGRPSPRLRGDGFSLFEVVIAAALLLLTVAVVTTTVVNASAAGSRLRRTMAVDRALAREVERLRALPYCAPAYPAVAEGEYVAGDEAGGAVGVVFPHAVAARNTASARFVTGHIPGDAPAGSFVSVREIDGVTVTMVARFVAHGVAEPLGAAAVTGWATWRASPPPAGAVEVHLRAALEGIERAGRVRFVSLTASRVAAATDEGGP